MRYAFADCLLDTDTLTLSRSGTAVPVEPQVFDLVRLLVENPGRVVTRDEIVAAVWHGRIVSDSAISARITAARKAVGDDGKRQAVIRTVARRGLQLAVPVDLENVAAATQARHDPDHSPAIRYTRTGAGQFLAYCIDGSGPPLLRISHVGSNIEQEWHIPSKRLLRERLAATNRLLCFDELGSGLSQRDVCVEGLEPRAENLLNVADAAGFDRFSILSESGSAMVALTAAAKWPERIDRLVLVAGYAEGRTRRIKEQAPEMLQVLIDEGWSRPQPAFGGAYIAAYQPDGPYEEAQRVVVMMQNAISREFMLRNREFVNNASVMDILPRISCPTLVVHSRHDGVHPITEAQKLASNIPGAELFVLDSANHIPLPGTPAFDPFIERVTDFLSQPGGQDAAD
jgi:DNA-binding winged helix-turn-helix (wHTH) protein